MQIHSGIRVVALMGLLRREIAERQTLLAQLEAVTARAAPFTKAPVRHHRQRGIGVAAVEVLRAAGRPMHAVREILPALRARGFNAKAGGFASVLRRQEQIVRIAPGTYTVDTTAATPE